jgi:hypothetical protein
MGGTFQPQGEASANVGVQPGLAEKGMDRGIGDETEINRSFQRLAALPSEVIKALC